MLAVTAIFTIAETVKLPSFACKVKVAFAAPQLATTSAVTLPFVLLMFEMVTPFVGLVEVTVTRTLPFPPKPVTLASCAVLIAEPCCTLKSVAVTIVGVLSKTETVSGIKVRAREIELTVPVQVANHD